MTAHSPANPHSAPPVTSSLDCVTSPNRKTFPSPWAKVGEPETTSIMPLSPSSSPPLPSVSAQEPGFSDCLVLKEQSLLPLNNSANQLPSCDGSNGNVGLSQKPAGKPLAETDSGPVPVIDGSSWPALAKPTPSSRDKTSSKSSKPSSNGSSVPAPNSQGQRSMKRGGGSATRGVLSHSGTAAVGVSNEIDTAAGGTSAQSGTAAECVSAESGSDQPPPLPPPSPRIQTPTNGMRYRGNNYWEARPVGGGGVGSRSPDHSSHRMNSSRRGNSGPRPHGGLNGGEYYHNHRHDHHNHHQDHRNNWNASRGSNARDVHLRPYREFVRPPPIPPQGSSPFIPLRPFGNPMGLDMAQPPFLYGPPLPVESYWPMPLDSHPSPPHRPIFPPFMAPPLATSLVNQIDFYFCEANLLPDEFLKKNMDAEGWVPISLIANFRRVKNMTNNIELILNSLRVSNVVEVQGDKVRRCND